MMSQGWLPGAEACAVPERATQLLPLLQNTGDVNVRFLNICITSSLVSSTYIDRLATVFEMTFGKSDTDL